MQELRSSLRENHLPTICWPLSSALTSNQGSIDHFALVVTMVVTRGDRNSPSDGRSLHSPVLEEGLQRLADSVPLLDGQQVLQLLAESATVHLDARRKDLCHPLQRAEGRRPGQWRITFGCKTEAASDTWTKLGSEVLVLTWNEAWRRAPGWENLPGLFALGRSRKVPPPPPGWASLRCPAALKPLSRGSSSFRGRHIKKEGVRRRKD